MQSLTHFSPAVGHKHRAIMIDVNKRAGLIEPQGSEGDAKLGGDESLGKTVSLNDTDGKVDGLEDEPFLASSTCAPR